MTTTILMGGVGVGKPELPVRQTFVLAILEGIFGFGATLTRQ
ncbi:MULTISPECIES: hypothetical protein [Roseobacteraceae]|nr:MULTISPECIES: hypothetical protein [Roseobacteraceae]